MKWICLLCYESNGDREVLLQAYFGILFYYYFDEKIDDGEKGHFQKWKRVWER